MRYSSVCKCIGSLDNLAHPYFVESTNYMIHVDVFVHKIYILSKKKHYVGYLTFCLTQNMRIKKLKYIQIFPLARCSLCIISSSALTESF